MCAEPRYLISAPLRIAGVEVTRSTANPEIATVAGGTITGQPPGRTEITASAGNASAKAVATVVPVATTRQRAGGDQQKGLPGAPLADSLVVRVVDRHGVGVPGVQVSFVVAAGGGSVSPGTATTDAGGYAAAEWKLVAAAVIQKVRAHTNELPDILPIEFAATAVVNEPATVALDDLERAKIPGLTLPRDGVYTVVVSGAWRSHVVGRYRFHIRARD